MPGAADVEQRRTRRHLGHDHLVVGRGSAVVGEAMAPAHDARRAVLGGEVVERPHHVDDELRVGTRDRVDGVVGVHRLRDFARTDLDAGRRAQLVVVQDPVEHGQDQRIGRGAVERAGLGEQRVDPSGPAALEVVASERRVAEDRGGLGSGARQGLGLEAALDDGVPVVVQAGADGIGQGLQRAGVGERRGGSHRHLP